MRRLGKLHPEYIHGHTAVLDLGLASSLECLQISIASVSDGIPKSDGRLNTQLFFECSKR